MQQSLLFADSLKGLKNLRTQLYSAAEYCELSYTNDEKKQIVVDILKDYAIKALVNTVDHLGSVSYKVNDLLDEKVVEVSGTEFRVSCIKQIPGGTTSGIHNVVANLDRQTGGEGGRPPGLKEGNKYSLRETFRAEEVVKAAKKKFDDETALLNDSNSKLSAANDIRQEAYINLINLKNQWKRKNMYFHSYRDDVKVARDYAVDGDKEALDRHCTNQVEKFMELWNKDDEFRRSYVGCNARSTLDGRSLGPNDPELPSLSMISNDRLHYISHCRQADRHIIGGIAVV
ncbi:hypothetical protein Dimus_034026 [Dionaea muscipula]